VLSELSKKHPNSQVAAFLNGLPKNDMFISVITPGEIIKGIEKTKDDARKKRFSAWYEKVCLWFEGKILAIDKETMVAWGGLVGNHKRTLPIENCNLIKLLLHRPRDEAADVLAVKRFYLRAGDVVFVRDCF
jgi:predicted nucleic acid-binding protein